MRLIDCHTLELEEFYQIEDVKYAILSHRWQDDELTYQDMLGDHHRLRHKKGYQKILAFCKKALKQRMTHVWVDTCCIDKTSSAELTEAINSMYYWYSQSTVCHTYLHDYESDPRQPHPTDEALHDSLAQCSWFYRGWTLQELIAPHMVLFYDSDWRYIGSKSALASVLSAITNVPEHILTGEASAHSLTIAERMSWASKRECTRIEDTAYSLLGLFDVNMPMLYGEGPKAFKRLQEEIIKQSNDQTIFLWQGVPSSQFSLLAPHPSAFTVLWKYRRDPDNLNDYRITNSGLEINLVLQPWSMSTYTGLLECEVCTDPELDVWYRPALFLARRDQTSRYVRATFRREAFAFFQSKELLGYCQRLMTINVASVGHREVCDPAQHYGIWLRSLRLSENSDAAPEQVLSQSDVYSQVQWDKEDCFFTVPAGQVGVVAIIYFPPELGSLIAALKIGFDFDFWPVCVITTLEGDVVNGSKDYISTYFRGAMQLSVDENVRRRPFLQINCMETTGWDDSPGDRRGTCDQTKFALKPPKITDHVRAARWEDVPVRRSTHIVCDAQARHWALDCIFRGNVVREYHSGVEKQHRLGWDLSLICTQLPHVVDCKYRDSEDRIGPMPVITEQD